MTKPTAQQCHSLTSYYVSQFKSAFDVTPAVNRNKARWGFESLLMDMSVQEAKDLIDFWLGDESAKAQTLDWFMYNYDKLMVERAEQDAARERRRALMQESAKRSAQWRAAGHKTISTEE